MHSGIYALVNTINGKIYIGSSKNLIKRQEWHNAALKRGKPINGYLKTACEKYSSEAFSFIIVEYCDISVLQERELFHIERTHPSLCYNIRRDANRMGGDFKMHSDEVKEFLRKKSSEEYHSNPNHGLKRKFMPEDLKQKMIATNKKKFNTPEMKKWASEHRKKWLADPANKEKHRQSQKAAQSDIKNRMNDIEIGKSKMVVDIRDGSFYFSINEAYKDLSPKFSMRQFIYMLRGRRKNLTNLELVE